VSSARKISNLALIGFMGAGKSSVGRLLAEQLRFQFLDTDELIEVRTGKSINDIFAEKGEESFRELESKVVQELSVKTHTVISAGGGLPINPANLVSLRKHALIVCLWASPEKSWERVRGQSHRPLLKEPDPLAKIRALLATREKFYKQADVLVNTEWRSIREVAQQVLHHFQAARSAEK
jgi:shikimate kinase